MINARRAIVVAIFHTYAKTAIVQIVAIACPMRPKVMSISKPPHTTAMIMSATIDYARVLRCFQKTRCR